jgi:protein-S-isoprenylcysteine O-methyltransferase Ste14
MLLMQTHQHDYANYLWLAAGLVWLVGALTAKRAERRQNLASRLRHLALEVPAFFLVFAQITWPAWLERRFLPESSITARWIGLVLTAAGIAFAIAARLWIGRNWSGRVAIKEQHKLIQNGPYSLVRHPIYSGFLLALLGTAIVLGEIRGLIGFALAALGWIFKLRTEEDFLAQQFGHAYLDYKQRVKALVPFVV